MTKKKQQKTTKEIDNEITGLCNWLSNVNKQLINLETKEHFEECVELTKIIDNTITQYAQSISVAVHGSYDEWKEFFHNKSKIYRSLQGNS